MKLRLYSISFDEQIFRFERVFVSKSSFYHKKLFEHIKVSKNFHKAKSLSSPALPPKRNVELNEESIIQAIHVEHKVTETLNFPK